MTAMNCWSGMAVTRQADCCFSGTGSSLHLRLNALAEQWLSLQNDGIPIRPDALLQLHQVDWSFWDALQRLEPFGVGHASPLFWARDCAVVEQRILKGGHLSLMLEQGGERRRGIAWRWDDERPVADHLDLAFRISLNRWKGEKRLQLEVKALRAHAAEINLLHGDRWYEAERKTATMLLRNDQGREIEGSVGADTDLTSGDPLFATWVRH